MEVSLSHVNWVSASSNTLDNATGMFNADCNVAPSDSYQRLLRGEDMISPQGDGTQVDHANVLLDQEDLEHLDWDRVPELNSETSQQQPWDLGVELQCLQTSQTLATQFPTVDQQSELPTVDQQSELPTVDQQSDESTETRGEEAFDQQSVFPTVDQQSDESTETPGEEACGEEDQFGKSTETCGGECSHEHIDESTSRPVLPSGQSIGVTFHEKNKQYEAHLWIKGSQLPTRLRGRRKKGVQIYLGSFGTEEEAKVAHDRAAIKLNIPPNARSGEPYALNFPEVVHRSYMEEHADWSDRDFLWKLRRTSNKFSKGQSSFRGVTKRKRSVKRAQEWAPSYEAKLSWSPKEAGDDIKRTFALGAFASEEEAGRVYDRAVLFLHQHLPPVEQLRYTTNFRPSSYSAEEIQAMASKLTRN